MDINSTGGTAEEVLHRLEEQRPEVVVVERPTPRGPQLQVDQVLEVVPETLVILLDSRQGLARFCFGGCTRLSNEAGIKGALEVWRHMWPRFRQYWQEERTHGRATG